MSSPLEPGRFFLPGPTEVHPEVLAAQTGQMIGHRGQDIQELMARIIEGLKPVFQTERPVIVSTSSATGLMEAGLRNGTKGGRVLSLVNGAFSARFGAISQSCGYDTDIWEVEWGTVHDPTAVAGRLAENQYDAVTISQSETSTGALQDLEAIASVVDGHEETFLLVDSVTGIGGVETRPEEWGIEYILTGSQKALALPPGLAFGLASDKMLERSAQSTDKGWYFDLARLQKQLANNETPATPAISLLYALDLQLKRINAETMETRWKRHLAMQQRTIEWIGEMREKGADVDVFASEGHRSPTVTCMATDDATRIVAEMRQRGFVVGAGYGKLKESTVRIGHMGDHTMDELDILLAQMTEVVL